MQDQDRKSEEKQNINSNNFSTLNNNEKSNLKSVNTHSTFSVERKSKKLKADLDFIDWGEDQR